MASGGGGGERDRARARVWVRVELPWPKMLRRLMCEDLSYRLCEGGHQDKTTIGHIWCHVVPCEKYLETTLTKKPSSFAWALDLLWI